MVFFVGIALSVLIAEWLRKRDLREAEQRAAHGANGHTASTTPRPSVPPQN